MNRPARLTIFLLAALLATAGCSDEGRDPTAPDPGGPDPVSFVQEIQPIFDLNCVGCHGAGGNAGLDLRSASSHANLVGTAAQASAGVRVTPGDPEASVLYLRLTGDGLDMMPPGGGLDTSTIDLVRRWIAEGAADN